MEYQIKTDYPPDQEQIVAVVKTWLRASPVRPSGSGFGTLRSQELLAGANAWDTMSMGNGADPFGGAMSGNPTGSSSGWGNVRERQRSPVTAPAQNVFSSHQMQTAGQVTIAPGIHLSQLSDMGHQHHHVFVLRDKTLLLIQQDGLHARWVNLFHSWHLPFASSLPDMPTPTVTQTSGLFQAVAWSGSGAGPAVSRLSDWQKLLWAAGEGVRQFGPQALEVIKEMLTWEGALTLLVITGLLMIPYVGEVVLVGLMGVALYDLLVNVTRLFKQYYETAVNAQNQADIQRAGKYFAQALVHGLLDVLAVFAGTAALGRLRALRVAGKLTLRAWIQLISEQAKQLSTRLRGGVKKLNQYIEERAQRTGKKKTPTPKRLPLYRTRPPFERNPKHSQAEFERQIQAQEDGLNSMTVDEYLTNSDRYKTQGRGGAKAQEAARKEAYNDKVDELIAQGKSPTQAEAEADTWMKTQDALHNPDQIAGGNPDHIGGMGDKTVNRSIGSQWEKKGIANDMDAEIRRQAASMTPEQRRTTKLNVKLDK